VVSGGCSRKPGSASGPDRIRTCNPGIMRRKESSMPMAARALPVNNLQQFASLRKVVRSST
jgi:hypothetical protein